MGRRAGRKSNPEAKRKKRTRGERRAAIDQGTDELRAKRELLGGGVDVGWGFPLDVLAARRLVTPDMRDEALRFAQLWWWRYGTPHASCEAIYERMCSGVVGEDFCPRLEASDEQNLARIRSQKERLGRMEVALQRAAPGVLEAVKRAAVFLELPRFILAGGRDPPSGADYREMARLVDGLVLLVALRDAEDKNWRRRQLRRAPSAASAAP